MVGRMSHRGEGEGGREAGRQKARNTCLGQHTNGCAAKNGTRQDAAVFMLRVVGKLKLVHNLVGYGRV